MDHKINDFVYSTAFVLKFLCFDLTWELFFRSLFLPFSLCLRSTGQYVKVSLRYCAVSDYMRSNLSHSKITPANTAIYKSIEANETNANINSYHCWCNVGNLSVQFDVVSRTNFQLSWKLMRFLRIFYSATTETRSDR